MEPPRTMRVARPGNAQDFTPRGPGDVGFGCLRGAV